MSTFIEIVVSPRFEVDAVSIKDFIFLKYALGASIDVHKKSILGIEKLNAQNGYICVDIFDAPDRDAAMTLASEWDLSPTYDTVLPKSLRDRMSLVFEIASSIKHRTCSKTLHVGFSDGGYYYTNKTVLATGLIDLIVSDCDSGGFVGNSYEIIDL